MEKSNVATASLISLLAMIASTAAAGPGLIVLPAAGSSVQSKPGPNDLSGRVVDEAGAAVADGDVWAVAGPWSERVTIATAKTDKEGRFVVANVWEQQAVQAAIADGNFGLFARARDGRVGWLAPVDRRGSGLREGTAEIIIGTAEEARGRVVDHSGKPIKGDVCDAGHDQPEEPVGNGRSLRLERRGDGCLPNRNR